MAEKLGSQVLGLFDEESLEAILNALMELEEEHFIIVFN